MRDGQGFFFRWLENEGLNPSTTLALTSRKSLHQRWGLWADRGNLLVPIMGIKIPIMGIQKRKPTNNAPTPSGVADALFSKVQQRVLAVLFGNHSRSFYASELIALAASGSGAVQRELAQLEAAELVTVKRVGNQKHYQANASAPIFEELRSLVLKTSGLVDALRSALAPLPRKLTRHWFSVLLRRDWIPRRAILIY